MNILKATIKASLFLTLIFISNLVIAQADSISKAHEADQWVKSKVWAPNLKINVYPAINAGEFERQYNAAKATWDKVFKFLADSANLATLAPGKYPIDGENAYASITDVPTRTLDAAKWESHRKYIDLQYVIRGEEKIGVTPLASATVTVPYNEAKDGANYTADGVYYTATPQEFYLFFPSEVHRPNIKVDGFDTDKKLVIKIKYVQ
jgi:YhcH/YjgK/YiaL family protein